MAMVLLAECFRNVEGAGPVGLVIAPTRDLAGQICGELRRFLAEFGLSVLCLTGGRGRALEQARLAEGTSVVVATPGRLRDHLRSGAFDPSGLRVVVLDEADDLVAGGFEADLRPLLAALPSGVRRHLCSATLTPEMSNLSRRVQAAPLLLRAAAPKGFARANRVRTIAVSRRGGDAILARLIAESGALQTLIFCNRRSEVARLSDWLGAQGYAVVALSGELSRSERRAALTAFRSGDASVCVATDLVSRGLVFPGLELVINADLPFSPQSLVHRCGRRALDGRAVLLVPHGRRVRAERMAERAGLILDWDRSGRAR